MFSFEKVFLKLSYIFQTDAHLKTNVSQLMYPENCMHKCILSSEADLRADLVEV